MMATLAFNELIILWILRIAGSTNLHSNHSCTKNLVKHLRCSQKALTQIFHKLSRDSIEVFLLQNNLCPIYLSPLAVSLTIS